MFSPPNTFLVHPSPSTMPHSAYPHPSLPPPPPDANIAADLHFDFASAVHAASPSFASDAEDADMRFERELADSDMTQYFAFDTLDSSSPFLTSNSPIIAAAAAAAVAAANNNNNNTTNSSAHASPPPPSDADGASPALSDSNSNFGFGSPSPASWSASNLPLADAGASPRSPPLYSPTHDFPALGPGPSGLALAFNDGGDGGNGGALFASPYGYEYASDPYAFLSANQCADAAGLGFSPNVESASMPWDTLDLMSAQQQTPSPKHSPMIAQQQQQQQLFLPSGAMDARPRPRLAPYNSPAISPRDLELHAPSTPTWAAHLWEAPETSSPSSMHPMLLGEHGRSASETGIFGHHHQGHAFELVPPPSAPAAIPIRSVNANNSEGGNTAFHAYGHSAPALAQLFQPSSAPAQAQAHAGSGFGFMPAESSPFALESAFSPETPPSPSRAHGNGNGGRNGNGSGLRARMRSYSHRVGSGLRDAQRAVFSTRASAGFAQGQLQQQQGDAYGRDNVRMKAEEDKAWSAALDLGLGTGFERSTDANMDMDIGGGTVRIAFPSSVPLPSSSSTSSLGLGFNEADPEATVRRKKRTSSAQTPSPHLRASALSSSARSHSREPSSEKDLVSPSSSSKEGKEPLRSELRPPKLAPSTWQLYFTDWIQRHQMMSGGDRKLNVAQAAKEAGAEYASLSAEQKEPYKRRSQAAKEARERELAAWQRTLTPEDIKRENAFRAAQRRAGKSRKGNIKDPNAPKKPLSAYFMFLQHIRADAERVRRVFGDERETTAQSVLAAQTWRAMSDEERKPFLAQAEKEKLAYEAARRMYEEGTVGFETTISFGNTNALASGSGSSSASGSGSGLGLGVSSTFPAYSPTGTGAWAGAETTFVIGRPAHEAGSDSEVEAEPEMDSEGCTTDEERLGPRRMGPAVNF